MIATEAATRWPEYAYYCRARERGLRSAAFQHMSAFVSAISDASFPERRHFVDWLCDRFRRPEADCSGLIPEPLLRHVLLPTLAEWSETKPVESAPYRWLGLLESAKAYSSLRAGFGAPTQEAQELLAKAIQINPEDQIALVRLVECKIGYLDFLSHHLPEGYLGDPEADLQLTFQAASLCQNVTPAAERDRLMREIAASRNLIVDLIESRRAGKDFLSWCREHGRNYRWNATRVYVRNPEPRV